MSVPYVMYKHTESNKAVSVDLAMSLVIKTKPLKKPLSVDLNVNIFEATSQTYTNQTYSDQTYINQTYINRTMNNYEDSDEAQQSTEEKLPKQIMENLLLEGINNENLLQNSDIVTFSNILSTLRLDLSTLLNEEIDEFQFQFGKNIPFKKISKKQVSFYSHQFEEIEGFESNSTISDNNDNPYIANNNNNNSCEDEMNNNIYDKVTVNKIVRIIICVINIMIVINYCFVLSLLYISRTICQDLLQKTSENIKVIPTKPNKSQSQQPKPQKNQIDINDVYAHLKRQPWHNQNQSPQYQQQEEEEEENESITKGNILMMGLCDDDEKLNINNDNNKIESQPPMIHQDTGSTTTGSVGWNNYINEVCKHDKQNHIFEPGAMNEEVVMDKSNNINDNDNDNDIWCKDHIVTKNLKLDEDVVDDDKKENDQDDDDDEEDEDEEEEQEDLINKKTMTLMGNDSDKCSVKFKNIPKCYEDIFSDNVNNIMNNVKSMSDHETPNGEINDNEYNKDHETPNLDNNDHNDDDGDDDHDEDKLINNESLTLMGFESINQTKE